MIEAFAMTWKGLWRGKAAWTALALAVAAFLFLPDAVRSDGSAAGYRELCVKMAVGGVHAVAFLSVLAVACGLIAREREDRRLALAVTRPVNVFAWLVGRWLACVAAGGVALAVSAFVPFRLADAPQCSRETQPTLPPAIETARAQLAAYLADPETPESVRKAPRARVLDLLVNKERERYESVPAGDTIAWEFARGGDRLRIRFATLLDNRATVNGVFSVAGKDVAVSNAVATPLEVALVVPEGGGRVVFRNTGTANLLARPRRDVTLLDAADGFAANCLRAFLTLLGALALAAAFGIFLSAAVSKPVALFTAFVWLAAAAIAPSAVEQFPDELHASPADRTGLWISRRVTELADAFSDFSAVGFLATDRCIENGDLARATARSFVLWPAVFLAAAAFLVRRKPL